MSTNFNKVKEFHTVFEHPINTKTDPTVFDTNRKLVNLRKQLIGEEWNELCVAIDNEDIVEVADALTDILYVVYGAGLALGIDLDKSFDLVHKSNMTKACKTEQEAQETVEFHKDRYPNPSYRKSIDGNYWIVTDENGKILKSKYYTPVDLSYVK